MAQQYVTSPVIEGGGVALPSLMSSGGLDYSIETSSSGSSGSVSSEPPTHSAPESFFGSEISSTPPAYDPHILSAASQASSSSPDVQEEEFEDSGEYTEVPSPMLGIIAFSQHHGSLVGDANEESSNIDSNILHPVEPIYAPDSWSMESPSSENMAQEEATAAELIEEILDGSLPTPSNVFTYDGVNMLTICQDFLPTLQNHDVEEFLQVWRRLWLYRKAEYPCISDEGGSFDIRHRHGRVSAKSMGKASCTIQGINWSQFQTTKSWAREMRRLTTKNFINMPQINDEQPSEAYGTRNFKACFTSNASPPLSHTDEFFRFRETNLKHVPIFSHNQLRHCLSAGSRNAVFFYDRTVQGVSTALFPPYFHQNISKIRCYNPEADSVREVIDLRRRRRPEFFRQLKIACVHAGHGLLIVGALREGQYAMKSLSNTCDAAHVQGFLGSSGDGGGVNHVHTFLNRQSGIPHAVFCDNEGYTRVVDCNTTQLVQAQKWTSFVNCSATSPDGRLRIHVSDDPWPIVAEAETGRVIARLTGHRDHGFACDWSPDGLTMATGHQDGKVHVWDARKMNKAVHVLPAEMGGVRSLHFSPLGSGHPVLVMAEPLDFVSIVDARTFQSKQDIEFLGEISGASMPPDGDAIFVGNADPRYGGIIEFERTGYTGQFKHRKLQCSSLQQRKSQRRQAVYNASPDDSECEDLIEEASPEAKLERKWKVDDQDAVVWQTRGHDWVVDADMNYDQRAVLSRKQRWHRYLGLEKMVF